MINWYWRLMFLKPLTDLSGLARRCRFALVAIGLLSLAGCQSGLDGLGVGDKGNVPIPKKLINMMKAKGMTSASPIMIRIFKEENVLEVWKETHTKRYALLDTYEICKWSGKFGPKFKEGDRQAPEGFYTVNKHQLNPRSQYHLSFNMGFPNAYDRAHGRTGSHLMIHGACSSAGCYSMTDERVEEIYALAREALKGGQNKFQIQAYPFRMTPENLVKHRNSPHYKFWTMLKKGYDHFEITRVPPKVNVCERRYEFNTASDRPYPTNGNCPVRTIPASLALAYTKRQNEHAKTFEQLLAKAEKRDVAEVQPLTVEAVFPGVKINLPQPELPKAEEPDLTAREPVTEIDPSSKPEAVTPATQASATGAINPLLREAQAVARQSNDTTKQNVEKSE